MTDQVYLTRLSKGMVERNNGYLETSFLHGRSFASPANFNAQLGEWLAGTANARTVRFIQGRPADLLETDLAAMIPLSPDDGAARRGVGRQSDGAA